MVRFLCELLSNRRFTLQTSDGRLSHPRSLKNGVPQGSTLSPLLFNIYIIDFPYTQSQQHGYADDLALVYVDKDGKKIENAGVRYDEHLCLLGQIDTEAQHNKDYNNRLPFQQ